MQIKNQLSLFVLILLFCVSCGKNNIVDTNYPQQQIPKKKFTYTVPAQLGDGIETASINAVGIDSVRLTAMMNELLNDTDHGIHSIVIFKENLLIFEEYFAGKDLYTPYQQFAPEIPHGLASVTKSFASALMGIAIDQGFVAGIEEKIFPFFPEHSQLNNDEKDNITIHHLLSMTSGFEWEENAYPFTDPRNDLILFNNSLDPIKFILSKPLINTPGTTFKYNGGTVNLAGKIISRASRMNLEDFSKIYLFDKLGITDFQWLRLQPSQLTYVSGDLHIRPRDMGKFGLLFLNKGNWNGEQVISEGWINESKKGHSLDGNYGYLWWRSAFTRGTVRLDSYHAGGWGGQFIFVLDEQNMVIVFTGGNFDTDGDTPVFSRIRNYIIPSIN